jgi:hypothetical protein
LRTRACSRFRNNISKCSLLATISVYLYLSLKEEGFVHNTYQMCENHGFTAVKHTLSPGLEIDFNNDVALKIFDEDSYIYI